jgi:hypothetical protein
MQYYVINLAIDYVNTVYTMSKAICYVVYEINDVIIVNVLFNAHYDINLATYYLRMLYVHITYDRNLATNNVCYMYTLHLI